MPITFEVDRAQKTVFAKAAGILTKHELIDYQQDLQSDLSIKYFHECFDMTAVTDVDRAQDKDLIGVAAVAVKLDDPAQPTRLAIIATNDLHYGLARMYETYRSMQPNSSRQVSVFRNREEALRWLQTEAR